MGPRAIFITYCIFLLLINSGLTLYSQNLVPNPSFETFSSCPTAQSQYTLAVPWDQPPGAIVTPDYFNGCASGGAGCANVDVPLNFGGNVPAFDGVAYGGVISHYTACGNCKEYFQVLLTSPLLAGEIYNISFRTIRAPDARYATNRMGAYLSTTAPSQPVNQPITTVIPQIEELAVISNSTTWTLIAGSYTALGGEQYITIGNFRDTSNMTIVDLGPTGAGCALVSLGAYYYIDSVIVQKAAPTLTVSNDTTICIGNSVQLMVTGDPNYSWYDLANQSVLLSTDSVFTVNPNQTTSYLVLGGTGSDTVTVTVLSSPPSVNLGNDTTLCTGASVTLDPQLPGYNYLWNNGANTQSILVNTSGIYFVDVSNICGISRDSINVNYSNVAVNLGNDTTLCAGQSLILNAGSWNNYSWQPPVGLSNPNGPSPIAAPLFTVTYTVTVTDAFGCTATDDITINVLPAPVVDAGPDQTVPSGTTVQLNASGGINYLWTPSTFLNQTNIPDPVSNPVSTITYTVTGTGPNGCPGSDFITLFVEGELVKVPNAFSPNGNGWNDLFVVTPNGIIKSFEITIFNRWGEPVFSSNDITKSWAGDFNGIEQDVGSFAYYITVTNINGEIFYYGGNITLLK